MTSMFSQTEPSVCPRFTHQAMVRDNLLDWAGDNVYDEYDKNQKLWLQDQRQQGDDQQKPAIRMAPFEAQILEAAIFDIADHE